MAPCSYKVLPADHHLWRFSVDTDALKYHVRDYSRLRGSYRDPLPQGHLDLMAVTHTRGFIDGKEA